jgi:hypothetical protein
MVEYTNHFGALTSSLFNIPIFGSLYVAVIALAFNLIISFGWSFIMNKKRSALLQTKKVTRNIVKVLLHVLSTYQLLEVIVCDSINLMSGMCKMEC